MKITTIGIDLAKNVFQRRWCMDRVRMSLSLTRHHSGGSHLSANRMRSRH